MSFQIRVLGLFQVLCLTSNSTCCHSGLCQVRGGIGVRTCGVPNLKVQYRSSMEPSWCHQDVSHQSGLGPWVPVCRWSLLWGKVYLVVCQLLPTVCAPGMVAVAIATTRLACTKLKRWLIITVRQARLKAVSHYQAHAARKRRLVVGNRLHFHFIIIIVIIICLFIYLFIFHN